MTLITEYVRALKSAKKEARKLVGAYKSLKKREVVVERRTGKSLSYAGHKPEKWEVRLREHVKLINLYLPKNYKLLMKSDVGDCAAALYYHEVSHDLVLRAT